MKAHYIRLSGILFLSLNILLFTVSIHAEEGKSRLDEFIFNVDTFQAGFKQSLYNEDGENMETSNGQVFMQKPGKFRWIYQQPYTQLIITNGETLWVFDADLEQVTIRDISDTFENTPAAMILSGKEVIDQHFIMNDMGEIDGYDWIELTPRDTENQYSRIRLGFDGDLLGMMILFDNLGQTTRIDFENQKVNQQINQELFRFVPPEGVDIIDDRDFSKAQ